MLKQLFISYRHESPEHARAVKRLGELLREARIPVMLDQFYLDENPGGPDDGWPKWCADCANNSACVIIVGSDEWFAAYDKTASAGIGLGAASEADIFRQNIWDEAGRNTRIRIAFLHPFPVGRMPTELRRWHRFHLFEDDAQLEALVRWVAECLDLTNVAVPAVTWPAPLAEFRPDLANRTHAEWPAVVRVLAGRARERIIFFQGESGLGKSALVREATRYAKQLGVPVVHVELKGGTLSLQDVLGQFDLELSAQLPNFCREGSSKTHLLRKDLRALRRPILVVFDSYEGCNKPIADWISQQFLPEVETALGLAVIVAGQDVPDCTMSPWRDLVAQFALGPINNAEDWGTWIERHFPQLRQKGADLRTVLMFAQGNPMVVSRACEVIAKN